jgi:hypothetical protein
MRRLADHVLDWTETLDHPRMGMVGNLLRLNLSSLQAAKDVIVGLELRGRAAEAGEIQQALEASRGEAGVLDRLCAVYGKGVKRPAAARTGLRRRAKALAALLRRIDRGLER